VRDVRVGRVESQNRHGLPHAAVVSWLLLVEEGVIHHVVSPVKSCEMVEEARNEVGSRNRSNIVSEAFSSP
jgi:hypothetical protein